MHRLFDISLSSTIEIILSALGVYVAVIVMTRIAGKRSFSKMSSFDFAMTISIGAIIATSILSPNVSLIRGVIGLISIFLLELGNNRLRQYNIYRKAVDSAPLLLMKNGVVLKENLKKAKVTEGDLRANLRQSNVTRLSEVQAVIFEKTGEISVIKNDEGEQVEEWLLIDVKKE